MQLIRKPAPVSLPRRAGAGLMRGLEFVFGEITLSSIMLVTAAFFIALFVGAVAGLLGGVVALVFVLLVLFVVIAGRDYRTGALIAVVLLPLSATILVPREILGIKGANPLNAVLGMSIICLILTMVFSRQKIKLPALAREYKLYIAVLAAAALHGAMSVDLIPTNLKTAEVVRFESPLGYLGEVLLKPIILLVCSYLLAVAVANAKSTMRYLIPLFSGAVLLALVVTAYFFASGLSLSVLSGSYARSFLSALGIHANELGLMFNMVFALALFTLVSVERTLPRVALGGVLVLLTITVGLTFSRGAFLGYLVVVAYFLFSQRRFRLMMGVVVILIMGAFLLPSAIVDRATVGVKKGDTKDVSAGRVDYIWRPLLPEVLASPLIGRGLSSVLWSDAARSRQMIPVGHPHSAYLGLILDFGFGGALFVIFFFRHMWLVFKRLGQSHEERIWRGYFQGATACVLLLLIQGVTDDRFTPTLPQSFLWLSYGLALGLLKRQNSVEDGVKAASGSSSSAMPKKLTPSNASRWQKPQRARLRPTRIERSGNESIGKNLH